MGRKPPPPYLRRTPTSVALTDAARSRAKVICRQSGASRSEIVDALLRQVPVETIIRHVREAQAKDALLRANWAAP